MASGSIRGVLISNSGIAEGKREGVRNNRGDAKRDDNYKLGQYNGALQNVKTARVYVFGNDNIVEEDENVWFEMPEMRSRLKGASPFSKTWDDDQAEYFEKEIVEGETLQGIALKYACAVSDLKRLNNLIQDQEFLALKVVKVPMKKHGVLSEQLLNKAKDHTVLQHSNTLNRAVLSDSDQESFINYEGDDSQHDFSDPDTQMKVMRTLSTRDNISTQGREAEKLFHKMDENLAKFKLSPRSERESLSEVISLLGYKGVHPLQSNKLSNKVNGATCGISWWSILIISLIIGIVVPVVLFLYIKFVMT